MSLDLHAEETQSATADTWPHQTGLTERSFVTFNEELRMLHAVSVGRRFSRNETIFRDLAPATHAYKIIDGIVRLCKFGSHGRRQIADFMISGDLFGFTEHAEHRFTAEAATDAILLVYPRHQINRLAPTNIAARDRISAICGHGLACMDDYLAQLGRPDPKVRLAAFLVRQSERTKALPGERLDLSMGRQDIADHLGLTVDSLCGAMAELKREGAILCPTIHQVILSDPKALRVMGQMN
jgi:CRP-like cAMP-binding protein